MATSKSPEDDKLKRLLYLCNTGGKYYCGNPEKNKPARATYADLLNSLLNSSQETLLKIIEDAFTDRYLPHRDQVFNVMATLLTLEGATADNKPDICQLAESLCSSDKDLFAFIKAVILTQQTDKKKLPPTVKKSVVRFYKNKSAEDLTKSYVLHKSYNGWKHKDIIKLFHIKSETAGKYGGCNNLKYLRIILFNYILQYI